MEEEYKIYEAFEWLTNNKNPSALAGNRFGGTEEAIAFVKKLYEAGAVSVSVTGIYDEPERVEEEGGPYADALIVELPKDIEKSEKIVKIYKNEVREYDMNLGEEEAGLSESEDSLAFWWD